MQKFVIEIKTHDDRIWFLERSRNGYATWTPEATKAKTIKTLDQAIKLYNRTARFAVCKTSCITGV